MLNAARTTDFLLSITAHITLEKHPITSRSDTRFGEEAGGVGAIHGGKTAEEGS